MGMARCLRQSGHHPDHGRIARHARDRMVKVAVRPFAIGDPLCATPGLDQLLQFCDIQCIGRLAASAEIGGSKRRRARIKSAGEASAGSIAPRRARLRGVGPTNVPAQRAIRSGPRFAGQRGLRAGSACCSRDCGPRYARLASRRPETIRQQVPAGLIQRPTDASSAIFQEFICLPSVRHLQENSSKPATILFLPRHAKGSSLNKKARKPEHS